MCQELSTWLSFLPLPLVQQPTPTQIPVCHYLEPVPSEFQPCVSNRLLSSDVAPLKYLKVNVAQGQVHSCLLKHLFVCSKARGMARWAREKSRSHHSFLCPIHRKGQRGAHSPPFSWVTIPPKSASCGWPPRWSLCDHPHSLVPSQLIAHPP